MHMGFVKGSWHPGAHKKCLLFGLRAGFAKSCSLRAGFAKSCSLRAGFAKSCPYSLLCKLLL